VAQYYVLFREENSSDAIPVKAKISKTGGLTVETEALNLEDDEEEATEAPSGVPKTPTRKG
jgi:hypothetical protein